MEEITAVLFFAFAGTVALAAVMLLQRKPETPAQQGMASPCHHGSSY